MGSVEGWCRGVQGGGGVGLQDRRVSGGGVQGEVQE